MLEHLEKQIELVEKRHRQLQFIRWITLLMLILGITSLLIQKPVNSGRINSTSAVTFLAIASLVLSLILKVCAKTFRINRRKLGKRIERSFPDLNQRLLTAVEVKETPKTFLEAELLRETVEHAKNNRWSNVISRGQIAFSNTCAVSAIVFCYWSFWDTSLIQTPAARVATADGGIYSGNHTITVEPGETAVEYGSSLVITARFTATIPENALLQIETSSGKADEFPMIRNLNDPVLGVVIPNITESFTYQVSTSNLKSDSYQTSVYRHPELVKSNAIIQYPDYTELGVKEIEDTIRISAVEGSTVTWQCYLNKPVQQALLVNEETGERVELTRDPTEDSLFATDLELNTTKRYRLILEDPDGRRNKYPPELVARVIENQPASLKPTLAGDSSVSPLEEFPIAAEFIDDFGILQFGVSYTFADTEPKDIVLGKTISKGTKTTGEHLISFEKLTAAPDDLLTYHFWAEDYGPDGTIRRTESDLFFAEVRPFEEIFREASQQSAAAQAQQQQQQGSQNGQQAEELANLQKEIINATWRLLREQDARADQTAFTNDVQLVIDSQSDALDQTTILAESLNDDRSRRFVEQAIDAMNQTIETLAEVKESPNSEALRSALQTETVAYSSLLKLRAREFEVSQSRQQSSSPQSNRSQSRRQQQLDDLELEQEEDRYETESQAEQANQDSEQERETRQVLNRLRDLARRQQDLNDAISELQTAIEMEDQRADKDEAERQLKRLREQQEDLLRETDELSERMQQNSNQPEMAEASEQLESTREQIRQASEQLQENNASEALTSGRRAERELEEMRDEFRQRASGQFNERMRELQKDATAINNRQQDIANRLNEQDNPTQQSGLRPDKARDDLTKELQEQAQELDNLLESMQMTVEESEEAEPLLAQRLYEAFRESRQRQTQQKLEESASLLERGFSPQAQDLTRSATEGIETLKEGVDRAAESVLGDETRALQTALSELEQLDAELQNEINQNRQANAEQNGQQTPNTDDSSTPPAGPATGSQPSQGVGSDEESGSMNANAATERGQSEDQRPSAEQPEGANRNNEEAMPQRDSDQNPAGDTSDATGQQNPSSSTTPGRGSQSPATPDGQPSGQPSGQGVPQAGSILDQWAAGNPQTNPLTGDGFRDWSDRLRDVEEMVGDPDLRSEAAQIRDRAREVRRESRRQSKNPQWDLVEEMIAVPLRELKKRVSDELIRRSAERNAVVPIDRDPVPDRYQDAIRDYYERLGSGE